jgi:hypothetical protein
LSWVSQQFFEHETQTACTMSAGKHRELAGKVRRAKSRSQFENLIAREDSPRSDADV